MRSLYVGVFVLAASVAASGAASGAATGAPALAEPSTEVHKMAADDCARARAQNKTCVLTIEDAEIEGGVPSAGETTIAITPFTRSTSLIRLRRDFIPEMLKTAEDL